jgi:membrane-bound metal-dependent hydrolase YbcI (DUF457 family)
MRNQRLMLALAGTAAICSCLSILTIAVRHNREVADDILIALLITSFGTIILLGRIASNDILPHRGLFVSVVLISFWSATVLALAFLFESTRLEILIVLLLLSLGSCVAAGWEIMKR